MKPCVTPDCGNNGRARAMCWACYSRVKRSGSLEPLEDKTAARFWAKVDRRDAEECWPWLGCTTTGYGRVMRAGVMASAHRVAYELTNGPIPNGRLLDHACRNRSCVNPNHLRLCTQVENMQNIEARGGSSAHLNVARRSLGQRGGEWRVQLRSNGIGYWIGSFDDEKFAGEVARAARVALLPFCAEDRTMPVDPDAASLVADRIQKIESLWAARRKP